MRGTSANHRINEVMARLWSLHGVISTGQNVKLEIDIMRRLRHPHITQEKRSKKFMRQDKRQEKRVDEQPGYANCGESIENLSKKQAKLKEIFPLHCDGTLR
ncbi:hypothetical protein L1987_24943 [Smallanthus sonchifolius]|uniref:Uncharacterized protein n=1 Tax=Smallanthus sonchifolius TaxID=185202 RepID=A0ACB9ILW0_9ASTR|nr:hypothetical protein L1987_24943 [Smallanthus sonchifolius]